VITEDELKPSPRCMASSRGLDSISEAAH